MKELLEDIDELLAILEGWVHESEGDEITKLRKRIFEYLHEGKKIQ